MLRNTRQSASIGQLCAWNLGLLTITAFSCIAAVASEPMAVCLGDVCFRPALASESSIISSYGIGSIVRGGKTPLEDERTRCYFDSELNAYVLVSTGHAHSKSMRLSHLFVSREPLCSSAPPSKHSFGPLRLQAPISLGDPKTLILDRLGPPQRKDDPVALESADPKLIGLPGYGSKYGHEKWLYFPEGQDSLLGWSIHFQDGKVKSVGIWDSP